MYSIISHAQNTTAFQPNVLLTGIHRLLDTHVERSHLPSANQGQGQLLTPQSVTVLQLSVRLFYIGI